MQSLAPDYTGKPLEELVPKLPQWQQLPVHEQRQLLSLMQTPEALSQLLAIQQAMSNVSKAGMCNPQKQSSAAGSDDPAVLEGQQVAEQQRPQQVQLNAEGLGHGLPASFPTNRQLPSPPQFDRSLLQGPVPGWVGQTGSGEASLLAARTSALHAAHLHQQKQAAPYAEFGPDLFRCSSMGAAYYSNPIPAELSFRASSMPGSYQDIAARFHLNRAGINIATSSMIPVISQDWLVIPFGTAQQLLPVDTGDVNESDGEAVMLCDERGQNWPMKCQYNRQEGSFQLSEGWKAFAQCWDLGHGEQLQLSRRFVSNGCVWLNVTLVRDSPIAKQAVPGDVAGKLQQNVEQTAAIPFWQQQFAVQQGLCQPSSGLTQGLGEFPGPINKHAVHHQVAKRPIISVQRVISCPTYCSRLHVNQHMAEHLLPVLPEAQNVKPPLSYNYVSLFKHKISVVDELNETWTVQYEGFVSAAQRHYRFTAGWTNLVKQKGIRVGDAVVLERWTEDRTKLHLHVIKGKSQDLPAAPSSITKVKSKRAARPAQRSKRGKASNGSAAEQTTGQGYSPSRGTSSALEALHDAALLCANTFSPDAASSMSQRAQTMGSDTNHDTSSEGHGVSAAAVAAADAAALRLDGSRLTQAVHSASHHRLLPQSRNNDR